MSSKEPNDVEKQFLTVTSEIELLLQEIVSLSSPGEELDVALDDALDFFTPLFELQGIDENTYENGEVSANPIVDTDKDEVKNKENEEEEVCPIVEETGEGSSKNKSKKTRVSRTQALALTRVLDTFVESHSPRESRRQSKTQQEDKQKVQDINEESVYESLTHFEIVRESHKPRNDQPSETY